MTICHPLISVFRGLSFTIRPEEGADTFFNSYLDSTIFPSFPVRSVDQSEGHTSIYQGLPGVRDHKLIIFQRNPRVNKINASLFCVNNHVPCTPFCEVVTRP